MSFVTECIQSSLPIWEDCLQTPFLRQLAEGTLDERCLLGYLIEDSLYLREYAKVFAWGMTKARTMEDIRICYTLLSFVNEGEDSTRRRYLDHFGVSDYAIQSLPQRPENRAYTEYMLRAAMDGGMAECMMACLPCMVSYHWIFTKLLEQHPGVRETPFWPLVRDYVSDSYASSCERWLSYADRLCEGLSRERKDACIEIFRACSEHELRFWIMSGRPRDDL